MFRRLLPYVFLLLTIKRAQCNSGVWAKVRPEDGFWGNWNDWSGCSVACGGGKLRRFRSCKLPKFGGVNTCTTANDRTEEETCNQQVCGVWSPWLNSTCSKTCGQGEITEARQCISTVTGNTVEPNVCGPEIYSKVYECVEDLCWNTVIQRRGQFGNPVDYFYRNWDEYVDGFGDTEKEFWLGLEQIYKMTNQKSYSLKIYMESPDGDKGEVRYSHFKLTENVKYTLEVSGFQSSGPDSNFCDSLSYHNGYAFTTQDQDNDIFNSNCAIAAKGAWWYGGCFQSNLNGYNLNGTNLTSYGIDWKFNKGLKHSLSFVEMTLAENPTPP